MSVTVLSVAKLASTLEVLKESQSNILYPEYSSVMYCEVYPGVLYKEKYLCTLSWQEYLDITASDND
jgi:hypothetical protein